MMNSRSILLIMWLVAALGILAQGLFGQVPPPDNILYGAAYYHEYMPYERLDEDIRLMKEAGISVVRVGESTWTSARNCRPAWGSSASRHAYWQMHPSCCSSWFSRMSISSPRTAPV